MKGQIFSVSLCLAVFSAMATAWADDGDLIEPSEAQLDLNEQGIQALTDGDHDRAVRLFWASLDLGELNITHTNLGRAFQRAGRCEEAEHHYATALEAPAVEEPAPDLIEGAIEAYRVEMADHCPGVLKVECDPQEISLFIDEEGPTTCADAGELELMPGRYQLRGEFEGNDRTLTVNIVAMDETAITLDMTEYIVEEEPVEEPLVQAEEPVYREVETIEQPPERDSSAMSFLFLTGSGLALAGGVALDTIPEQSRNGEVNAINFVPVFLYAAGITVAIFGIRGLRK